MFTANLLSLKFALAVPGVGSAWMLVLLASAACASVLAWSARNRARREDPR
jgi:hypothetical protein